MGQVEEPTTRHFAEVKFKKLQPKLLHMLSSKMYNQIFYTSQAQEPTTKAFTYVKLKNL